MHRACTDDACGAVTAPIFPGYHPQEAERLRERVGAYESQAAERAKGWQDRVSQLQDLVRVRVQG